MIKTELMDYVAAHVKEKDIVSRAALERIVNSVFDGIREEVASGGEVQIVGFGTFKAMVQSERTLKNPEGVPVHVPEKKVPKFKAGKQFKEMVNSQ